jgi:hypothetical protein
VPIWHQLKPQCCIRLEVLLRWNEGGHDAELTLMEEKKDPLCLLEEISSLEAPFLPDVGQRRHVVNPPQD